MIQPGYVCEFGTVRLGDFVGSVCTSVSMLVVRCSLVIEELLYGSIIDDA